jgi:general secretion pathway protein F
MGVYRYKAVGDQGAMEGLITAETAAEGRMRLRRGGLQVVQFEEPDKKKPEQLPGLSVRRAVSEAALNEATHYLALLLRSGVPLAEAIGVVARQVPRALAVVLKRVGEKLSAGTDLGEALESESETFDPAFIGVVRVGQASGTLDQALQRLVSLRRRRQQLRQRVGAALTYPVIVSVVGILVVAFLMTFVVPRITTLLAETGRSMPLPTQLLMGMTSALRGPGGLLLTVAIGGIGLIVLMDPKRRVQTTARFLALRLPLVGPVSMKAGVAQMAAMLEAMLKSGLPLDESLDLTRRSIQNPLLERDLSRISEALRSGQTLASLKETVAELPPVVMHVLAVGEQTGQLEQMLGELAESYDADVDVAARRAVSVLEPILIVLISLVVGFIVLATILPIVRLSGSL